MKLTAKEIADIVLGRLSADPAVVIRGAASLEEAGPEDVSFIANPKYASRAGSTRAGLLLVPESLRDLPRPAVMVANPHLAFAKILSLIEEEKRRLPPPGIHPAAVVAASAVIGAGASIGPCAVIEDGVRIGDGTVVYPHCFIGSGTVIGEGCTFYANVTIRENAVIGSRVVIQPGAVIGSDGFGFVPGKSGHYKIPQIGTVVIGDDVEIGANAAIDRATTGATVIGRGTKLDNLVHVAHNVCIGEHCLITAQNGIAGSARIGNFVTTGGQVGIAGHITIGDGVTVAAKAGVTTDIPPNETISGFPARLHREELKVQALTRKLPQLYELFRKLSEKK